MLNSISVTTERVDNQKDMTMESQVSQEEMTTMSQADEVIQDLKMNDAVKILRKQSDGLANFQKYDEKKELEKIQQTVNSNARNFDKGKSIPEVSAKIKNDNNSKSEVKASNTAKNDEIEEESDDDPSLSSKELVKIETDQTLNDGGKKKRKRKKKKKSKTGKTEKVQVSTEKPPETNVSSAKTEAKPAQEPPQVTAPISENVNLFLKEDNLDTLADRINLIVEEEDPFEAIF